MKNYKVLNNQIYKNEDYTLVPIRYEDRFEIMRWRNEQIYHLRQTKMLSDIDQEEYFRETVIKLFDMNFPTQILFSFLKNKKLIGYGGLVHINWESKNSELSFLMNTKLEKNYFNDIWNNFLILIEDVAFNDIMLHKIYTYAFDLRPQLYSILENYGYVKEATLKEHHFHRGNYINIVIHSKINEKRY